MPELQRLVAHFDLDYFFVAVEELLNPSLKGKPVILANKERGIVTTCNYEARKFGVHSAMPGARAYALCPQGIFLKGNYAEYRKYSRKVTEIIRDAAPVFEKASVDEFYIELTGMDRYFNPLEWTIQLREKIMRETGLPISFGISCNKYMAKMATNLAKPNGYLLIPPGKELEFLAPLKVEEIPGVGKNTLPHLHAVNIHTIGDLQLTGKERLVSLLGNLGEMLWTKCQGISTRPVNNYHEAKSISAENTFFDNLIDAAEIHAQLVRLTEKVCFQLRGDGKVAACAAVKIRYGNFETNMRQTTIPPTQSDDEVIPVINHLFQQSYKGEPIRLLGVRLSDLSNDAIQTNLFENSAMKPRLYRAIDKIKDRYGHNFIKRASGK